MHPRGFQKMMNQTERVMGECAAWVAPAAGDLEQVSDMAQPAVEAHARKSWILWVDGKSPCGAAPEVLAILQQERLCQ
jgi:hypothetical protein